MEARLVLLVEQYSWVLVGLQSCDQVEQIEDDENESKDAVSGQRRHKVGRNRKAFCDCILNQMQLL